jgi:hypothetical protein
LLFSALEGDANIAGDNLSINGTILTAANNAGTVIRPTQFFFNSSVTFIALQQETTEII